MQGSWKMKLEMPATTPRLAYCGPSSALRSGTPRMTAGRAAGGRAAGLPGPGRALRRPVLAWTCACALHAGRHPHPRPATHLLRSRLC